MSQIKTINLAGVAFYPKQDGTLFTVTGVDPSDKTLQEVTDLINARLGDIKIAPVDISFFKITPGENTLIKTRN